MSLYSIEHIVKELFEERTKSNNTPHPAAWKAEGSCVTVKWKVGGAQAEIYWQTWQALNTWIESQLSKKLGATVPHLGSFTWEKKNDLYRPIFLLSESFVKAHRVKRKKSHKIPDTAPSEDINYSKIAIKFSDNMTKDMIFCGTRDIVKKIGDYFDFGYQADIDFSFGTLMLREKRVKFEFNLSRLMKILPENAFDEAARAESPRKQIRDSSGDSTASTVSSVAKSSASTSNIDNNDMISVSSSSTFNTGVSDMSSRSVNSKSASNVNPLRQSGLSSGAGGALPKLDISKIRPSHEEKISSDEPFLGEVKKNISPLRTSAEGSFGSKHGLSSSSSDNNNNSNNNSSNNCSNNSNNKPPMSAPGALNKSKSEVILGIAALPTQSLSERHHDTAQDLELNLDDTNNIFSQSNGGRPISPGLVRVLMALEEPKGRSTTADKLEARKKNVLKVQKDAYMRNFSALENTAKEADRVKLQEFEIMKAWKEKESSNKGHGQAEKLSLQATLEAQVHAFEQMKIKQKQEMREATINQLRGVGQGLKLLRSLSKEELHKELSKQIEHSTAKKEEAKFLDQLESKEYLEHIALENDLTFAVDRAKHLEKQRALLDAWERDAHIRNMKKLTQIGSTQLKDYMNSTGVIENVLASYV